MTRAESTTCQVLRSPATAASVADQLRRSAQGQLFTLLARPDPQAPFRPVATLAGSALRGVTAGEWHAALGKVEGGPPASPEKVGPLLLGEHLGRPLLWREAVGPCHLRSFAQLQERLALLRPAAARYRAEMEALRRELPAARCVEGWREISQRRLRLVRQTLAEVVAWAGPAAPTLLLVGSSAYGLGLVSDVDFVPLWPAAAGPGGDEAVERLSTGLHACDVRADNVVARWSLHRRTALSLDGWPAEVASADLPFELASCLAVASTARVVGDEGLAGAFVAALTASAGWRLPLGRWRRRWAGWWADLQARLSQSPPAAYRALVPLCLRQLTALRELLQLHPGAAGAALPCDPVRLRDELAWFRDLLDVTADPAGPDGPGPQRLDALALGGAAEVERRWKGWLAELDALAAALFRAAGLSFWRGRLGRAVAVRLFGPPLPRDPAAPLVLLHACRLPATA